MESEPESLNSTQFPSLQETESLHLLKDMRAYYLHGYCGLPRPERRVTGPPADTSPRLLSNRVRAN